MLVNLQLLGPDPCQDFLMILFLGIFLKPNHDSAEIYFLSLNYFLPLRRRLQESFLIIFATLIAELLAWYASLPFYSLL